MYIRNAVIFLHNFYNVLRPGFEQSFKFSSIYFQI